MTWKLEYSSKARKQLKKLDAAPRNIILSWMNKNIDGSDNPRLHGKGLLGDHAGAWRYRIGDYRVLCEIHEQKLTVLVINVGHRKSVYRNRRT